MTASGIEQVLATEQRLQKQLRAAKDKLQREFKQQLLALQEEESRRLDAAIQTVDAEISQHFQREAARAQQERHTIQNLIDRLERIQPEQLLSVVQSHLHRRMRGDRP